MESNVMIEFIGHIVLGTEYQERLIAVRADQIESVEDTSGDPLSERDGIYCIVTTIHGRMISVAENYATVMNCLKQEGAIILKPSLYAKKTNY